MKDGREAFISKVTPLGDDDWIRFDDGHEEKINAWQIAEELQEGIMLDLDALSKAAAPDGLMVPSREWQETFTAPVVRDLIEIAKASRRLIVDAGNINAYNIHLIERLQEAEKNCARLLAAERKAIAKIALNNVAFMSEEWDSACREIREQVLARTATAAELLEGK